MQRVRICAHMRAHHLGINQGLAAGGRPSLVIAWLQGHVCRCTCRAILGHEKGIHLRVGVRCGESQMRACDWPYLRTSKHVFSVPLLILSTCTHTHTHTRYFSMGQARLWMEALANNFAIFHQHTANARIRKCFALHMHPRSR